MYKKLCLLTGTLATLVIDALGHARVTTPTPRALGPAAQAACGGAVYTALTSSTSHLEIAKASIDGDYNAEACHLYFCRGAQYEDNVNNTRVYTPGTVVPFHIEMIIRHTGWANVSIVNLATQTPIARLFTWPVYANQSLAPSEWPKNETDFQVTVPDLKGQCSQPNACAIKWWWYAGYSVNQTYENCIDFTQ
ncbi:hypothetical protein L218DRAFT_862613 [Marasmius fiardii PR-910]|nr:hypothetical protein L218DRAFT_862613 [Marasmius fiardii PR-910]